MREDSINMAELISDTTRKGDTLEPGTPSQALSDRNTANARIMAETISNPTPDTATAGAHSRKFGHRAVFHFLRINKPTDRMVKSEDKRLEGIRVVTTARPFTL